LRAGGASYQAIANKVGVSKSTVQEAFGVRKRGKALPSPAKAAEPKRAGRSLAEFRATYDKDTIVPGKIRAALKVLDVWQYEAQFAKLAGVSLSDLGNYRDKFAGYVVALRESRRAWAKTTAIAKAMREMI
jgi:transposase